MTDLRTLPSSELARRVIALGEMEDFFREIGDEDTATELGNAYMVLATVLNERVYDYKTNQSMYVYAEFSTRWSLVKECKIPDGCGSGMVNRYLLVGHVGTHGITLCPTHRDKVGEVLNDGVVIILPKAGYARHLRNRLNAKQVARLNKGLTLVKP